MVAQALTAWPRALLLLVLALAGSAPHAAEPAKPTMAVAFEIAAPTFRRTLPERERAESHIAQKLADEFEPRHPFADWAPAPTTQPAMGHLVARLLEDTDARPYARVVVKWFVKPPSGAEEALPLQPIEIYAASNPNWDSSNRAAFEARVVAEMLKVVQVDGFHEATFKHVLSKLPIATRVMAVESDRAIVVPLLWRHVRLGQNSELLVKFSKTTAEGQKRQGSVTLGRIIERPRREGIGYVQAGVLGLVLDTQPLPLQQQWNHALPGLLDQASVSCFLVSYQQAEYDDGLVRDLPR